MNDTSQRMPCPACAEPIMQAAKICPHCKTSIMSKDAGKNAALNLVWYVVIFLLLFYAFDAFVNMEAERSMSALGL